MLGMLGPDVLLKRGGWKMITYEAAHLIYRWGGPPPTDTSGPPSRPLDAVHSNGLDGGGARSTAYSQSTAYLQSMEPVDCEHAVEFG